ncbi:MlaE family lipid ABC transporter permease subunit [Rhodovulum sp. DZ06]|uniref:MlaE family lipid ABC transporter permease subunit n=1 Tax=Rhodovulum sp. DZ06 TaxID=3425126 RepID=UPI003D347A0C
MPTPDPSPQLVIDRSGDALRLAFTGPLLIATLRAPAEAAARLSPGDAARVRIDVAGVTAMDTAGAWLALDLARRFGEAGAKVDLVGLTPERKTLVEAVRAAMPDRAAPPPRRTPVDRLADFGAGVEAAGRTTLEGFGFFGLVLSRIGRTIVRPGRLRFTSLVHHCGEAGFAAVPIVALMAFMIGVVLAFQGSVQLRNFGAEVFVVDLISVSVLRELGILLTAIIVAGRSGSAFTAAIGSMKVREEIDAMRTLGLDPIEVLALPRALALLLMLPVLGVVANFAGLAGGLLMSWIELGVSPGMFLSRLQENTDVNHMIVGMVKAPVFALLIGVIGCWQGFQVGASSESVGRRTTTSVVMAIFSVIIADALFSIFFAELGI